MPHEWMLTIENEEEFTNTSHALYKHSKTHTNYLEMYDKWARVHEF